MSLESSKLIATSKNYGLIDPMIKTLWEFVDFNSINTIYDIGSRDALQSNELSNAFPLSKIFAFEANPESLPVCYENARGNSNIKICPMAVSDMDGEIDFFAADMAASGDPNIGISSILKLMNETPRGWRWTQKKISVPSITLNNFVKQGNPSPDLVWIDIQGAELLAFKGAYEILPNVKAIFTEAGKRAYYHGHGLVNEIDLYLKSFGFKSVLEVPGHEYESDFLYINENNKK